MNKTVSIYEKHSLWLRWTHWINFPVLFLMIWSGILIYWANPAYPPFFPQRIYKVLGAEGNLADGMGVHFALAWFFTLNGLFYISYLIFSGHWRELIPTREGLFKLPDLMLHEIGLKKAPFETGKYGTPKFNTAQQLAYLSVNVMGLLSVLSGIAIYKPIQLQSVTSLLGGYEIARFIHFVLTLGYLGFFAVHVIQVVRAGWNNFRSMVVGFEETD